MNTYVANSVALDHVDSLVASAAAYRRAKEARLGRRAHRTRARRFPGIRAAHPGTSDLRG